MKIKNIDGQEFEVKKLDTDNEVEFLIEGAGDCVRSWINISETLKLIKFLQKQVDTFNDKMI